MRAWASARASTRTYYVYDGSDVALELANGPGNWKVQRRNIVGGVDEILAGRYWLINQTRSLTLVTDRQGSPLEARRAGDAFEASGAGSVRDAFGRIIGSAPTGESATGTGFAGAGSPNAGGGFVYLRNRWYDPATGRFLTQDPIGLAGGVNLYAYAGGNPIAFSDPFGLDTIEVQTHEVAAGQYHASIRITPKDQARWSKDSRFQKGEDGQVSITLGAGPKLCLPQGSCLVSDANRPTDAAPHAGSIGVDRQGRDENEVIAGMLTADAKYGDNLRYQALPSGKGGGYNSNSYASGILRAVGLSATPVRSVPGWSRPIPTNPLPF